MSHLKLTASPTAKHQLSHSLPPKLLLHHRNIPPLACIEQQPLDNELEQFVVVGQVSRDFVEEGLLV